MLKIVQRKKEYYDQQKSHKFVSCVENLGKVEKVKNDGLPPATIILDAEIIGPTIYCDENGIAETCKCTKGDSVLFLNEESCKEINKCIDDLHRYFKKRVSYNLIQRSIYEWVFNDYSKEKQASMCTYVEEKIALETSSILYIIPLPYIQVTENIKIGNVNIGFLDRQAILDNLFDMIENKEILSMTAASVMLEGELIATKELAHELVETAVDILKASSALKGDINSCLYDFSVDINGDSNKFGVSYAYDPQKGKLTPMIKSHRIPYEFDEKDKIAFETCNSLQLMSDFMSDMYFSESYERTDLDKVILRSIKQFSASLSTKSPHERVVKLCSILDAAVLKNSEVGIKDSQKKYIPILIAEDGELRDIMRNTLDRMYEIRSNYIHHGKEETIKPKDILELNMFITSIILRFIQLRTKYDSTNKILSEIDKLPVYFEE